jgi:preprotein translocase subunit SecA
VSLDDELLVRNAPRLTRMLRATSRGGAGTLMTPMLRRLFKYAQSKAQRGALAQRKGVLSTDDWLDDSLGFAGQE